MKMLFMIYDVDFDDDVMDVLSTCCVTGYTKWSRVLGLRPESPGKLKNHSSPLKS